MSGVRNTMRLVESALEQVDVRYDIRAENIKDIYAASNNPFDMICKGFMFGYMQGVKATRAKQKARVAV